MEKKMKAKKKDKTNEGYKYHSYFKMHECLLPSHKLTEYEIICGRMRKTCLDFTSVNYADIRAKHMYKSYAALCAEKYHNFTYYPVSIHPFSKFRVVQEGIIIITTLICDTMLALFFSEVGHEREEFYSSLFIFLDIIYLINIICNCFTGYVSGRSSQYVVLDLKRINLRYLTTWLIVDLASVAALPALNRHPVPRINITLLAMKILRMPTVYRYINNYLRVNKAGLIKKTVAHVTFSLTTYLKWNIFFQFAVEYYEENDPAPLNPRECSWMYIGKLWNKTTPIRFVYALDRAVGMLRQNSNLNLTEQDGCFEYFFVISWIIAKLIVIHCGLKYMIALFGCESARAKYFVMAQQVETYMNQRKFPPRLKKKILKFYAIRFQSNFFVESRMISCVSGQLREDIIMHTGGQLVSHVAFLKQQPRSLLLQIGLKLKIAIFIAGDIIFKINTIGDCLYFIHKGTVAIYCESGKEVCHLDDGDFFGEIALVMKHRFRTASAVAVSNCELFRLDRADFESSIACYPTIYEDIQRVATSRFERTNILDEHHKTDMKVLSDSSEHNLFE